MPKIRFTAKSVLTVLTVLALLATGLWFAIPDPPQPIESKSEVADEPSSPERPAPNFPVAVGGGIPFKDSPDAGADGRSSYRTFEITLPSGRAVSLTSTYLDEPDWIDDRTNDSSLIFRLADFDAAFSEDTFFDLPKAGTWERIRLHIGGFSQDGCGAAINAVVSFRSDRIFAISFADERDIDFSASNCPLNPEDYFKNKAKYGKREGLDDVSAYCEVRRECLTAYYSQPENRTGMHLEWVDEVGKTELR